MVHFCATLDENSAEELQIICLFKIFDFLLSILASKHSVPISFRGAKGLVSKDSLWRRDNARNVGFVT